jgi:hypothetical protein
MKDETTRLIGVIRWHMDRADIETGYGNPREARRHKDLAHELAARVRAIDGSRAIDDIISEMTS